MQALAQSSNNAVAAGDRVRDSILGRMEANAVTVIIVVAVIIAVIWLVKAVQARIAKRHRPS